MATVLETLKERSSESARLPDYYEVVNGEIVESRVMSDYANEVADRLHGALAVYLHSNDIGTCGVERLFRIPLPEDRSRNRRPDFAFVSYQRWPKTKPFPFTGNARDVVPDIAVEVISPGDLADELLAKAREYLRGGVQLVWLIYPLSQEVHAYRQGVRNVGVYFSKDNLEAGELLPGFSMPVATLFPPVELPPTQAINDACSTSGNTSASRSISLSVV